MTNKRASRAGEPLIGTVPGQTSPRRRILVADDEPVIRSLITAVLVRSGYDVDAAQDGAAAWAALRAKHYALLITDNSMPKITGLELVEMLREHAFTLPVIMATGVPPTEHLERHPWLRISAILRKPFAIEDLLKTVNKTLHEADIIAVEDQFLSSSDTKNFCLPVAIRSGEAAERLAVDEPMERL
ncbi:MAG TPA: response regulator [Candidatus Baltobacteraceae bacterium]|jgi:CheY-like chemotaxis protein|nr:response regulator [Candidatus Baltobacteraceae bacterium]